MKRYWNVPSILSSVYVIMSAGMYRTSRKWVRKSIVSKWELGRNPGLNHMTYTTRFSFRGSGAFCLSPTLITSSVLSTCTWSLTSHLVFTVHTFVYVLLSLYTSTRFMNIQKSGQKWNVMVNINLSFLWGSFILIVVIIRLEPVIALEQHGSVNSLIHNVPMVTYGTKPNDS